MWDRESRLQLVRVQARCAAVDRWALADGEDDADEVTTRQGASIAIADVASSKPQRARDKRDGAKARPREGALRRTGGERAQVARAWPENRPGTWDLLSQVLRARQWRSGAVAG